MNIKYISCLTSNCGIGRYTEELAKSQFESEHEVTLFRKNEGNPDYVKTYPFRSFKGLKHYVAPYFLSNAINNQEADIWHADYVDSATALKWSKHKNKNQKVVVTCHDAIPLRYPNGWVNDQWYRYMLNNTVEIADQIIVVSENSKQDLINLYNVPEEQIKVVYNGINHSFFYPDQEKVKNDIFTIRYVGGLLVSHKNAIALIETAKVLQDRGIEVKIEIGSGAAELTPLPALVEKYKLKNISFEGFVPNNQLRSFLAGADVFLYPSLYEGFGFPPIEAMACGTAVVSSGGGSLREVLRDGAYVTEAEPEMFAEAIIHLIEDSNLKKSLEQKGIKVAQEYTWEKACAQTTKIYNDLLN
ncbi:glycosyltransferase family 4 protein [Sediminitomix flava]|uniref:Glycosyltransferase involved in cell wall biosynthesis n=1 Tax=Sediminitomix flava TaxID=379075 RepID=A0A315Z7D1_SEDFL|nr:glycosyltransferase family 1 protein [Sediminitomix flava]PWJ38511.1 glycosyltransferase involved in cell wall biosynthesis [Sediminitomix flava]